MDLKQLINSTGMSVYEFAKKADIPKPNLYVLARGQSKPEKMSVVMAYKIAKTLNITVEELIKELEILEKINKK